MSCYLHLFLTCRNESLPEAETVCSPGQRTPGRRWIPRGHSSPHHSRRAAERHWEPLRHRPACAGSECPLWSLLVTGCHHLRMSQGSVLTAGALKQLPFQDVCCQQPMDPWSLAWHVMPSETPRTPSLLLTPSSLLTSGGCVSSGLSPCLNVGGFEPFWQRFNLLKSSVFKLKYSSFNPGFLF